MSLSEKNPTYHFKILFTYRKDIGVRTSQLRRHVTPKINEAAFPIELEKRMVVEVGRFFFVGKNECDFS